MLSEIIGKKYWQWTVLSYAGKDKYSNKFVLARCTCGFERKIRLYNLEVGDSKQCIECKWAESRGKPIKYNTRRKTCIKK